MGLEQITGAGDQNTGLREVAIWAAALGCLNVSFINTPQENLGAVAAGMDKYPTGRFVVTGESYEIRNALPPVRASELARDLDRRFSPGMIDVDLGSDL